MTNTKILISCSEGDLSVSFACKLRYCTGVWPFGRIERVRNSKCSMFNELERNKIIIYTVRIIRVSTVYTVQKLHLIVRCIKSAIIILHKIYT